MNLKEAALSYARAGFKVFPLQPDTKSKHVLKSWIEEASSDEQIIEDGGIIILITILVSKQVMDYVLLILTVKMVKMD